MWACTDSPPGARLGLQKSPAVAGQSALQRIVADRRGHVAHGGRQFVLQGYHAACAARRARAGDRVRRVRARERRDGADEADGGEDDGYSE